MTETTAAAHADDPRGRAEDHAPRPSIRPRHAATLILLRREDPAAPAAPSRDGTGLRVLMGARSKKHVFMPNVLVFPGGAIERADHRIAPHVTVPDAICERLARGHRGANPRSLLMAAIRETFEETGLRLARPAARPLSSRAEGWRDFLAGGHEPAPDRIDYVARAITPPGRPRRFDTRFLLADAEAILGDPDDLGGANGELLKLAWRPVPEVLALDIRPITKRGLEAALRVYGLRGEARRKVPVPYHFMRSGRRVLETL